MHVPLCPDGQNKRTWIRAGSSEGKGGVVVGGVLVVVVVAGVLVVVVVAGVLVVVVVAGVVVVVEVVGGAVVPVKLVGSQTTPASS